ncbi:MAG: MFS transporter [Clostridiales bacterium]|nr:MFS transporter [Clostridiales bacterium]
MEKSKLSSRIWFNLVLFGFMGQVAWAVENVYFNTFLFNFIGGDAGDISLMVSLSAATAVATTFIMGTLSDKLNKRKIFISGGYILWGLTVAVFALISRENVASFFNISNGTKAVAATVSIVIIMDCIMTFMGSTSNDAAFNAWITDVTVPSNRGVAEGALAVMPVLSTLLVTVAFGAGVTAVGYPVCFIGLGALVTLCGVVGFFSLKDSRSGVREKGDYLNELIYGFRPSVIKENKSLYLVLAAVCIFSSAVQVFLPYMFLYIQHFLKFDFNSLAENLSPKLILTAVAALAAFVAVVILLGKLLDKFGKGKFVYPSIVIFIVGLVASSFAKKIGIFAVFAALMFCGYGLLMIILNASVRDFTPEDKAGLFQGIRMIFFVLIPMIVGPFIGKTVINAFAGNYAAGQYINDYGEAVNAPVPEIFIAAAIISVFIIIPMVFVRKKLSGGNEK